MDYSNCRKYLNYKEGILKEILIRSFKQKEEK